MRVLHSLASRLPYVSRAVVPACIFAAVLSGCGFDKNVATGDPYADTVFFLATSPYWVPKTANYIYSSVDQAARDGRGPPRQLHTIKGRVTDLAGSPLAATLVVRVTDAFTLTPDRLASYTFVATPDGAFDIPIGNHNALCVDFAAPGMQPARKWFLIALNNVATSLPPDQTQIVFVSPYYEMDRRTTIQLPSGEP